MLFQPPLRCIRTLQQFDLLLFLSPTMSLPPFSRRLLALVLFSLAFFGILLFVRHGLLESGFLPAGCGAASDWQTGGWCSVKWLLVQMFINQRLGLASIICATLAFILRIRWLALAGWLAGLAGLVLYNYDYAAPGAMLALLVLVRVTPQKPAKK